MAVREVEARDAPAETGFSATTSESPSLEIKGAVAKVTTDPTFEGEVELRHFPLAPVNEVLPPFGSIELRSGALSVAGSVGTTFREPVTATLKGGFTLVDLEVIGAEALSGETVSFDLGARTFTTRDLVLDGTDGKLIIGADGRINVASIGDAPPGATPPAASEPAAAQVSDAKPFVATIERLRIREGKLEYADFLLRPNFHTRMHGLDGWIGGLTTTPGRIASVKLAGRVDRAGSVKIDGLLAPFDPVKQTEMTLAFQNIEMRSFTPYSAKFAGYRIESASSISMSPITFASMSSTAGTTSCSTSLRSEKGWKARMRSTCRSGLRSPS
jgi:hypothetical protein